METRKFYSKRTKVYEQWGDKPDDLDKPILMSWGMAELIAALLNAYCQHHPSTLTKRDVAAILSATPRQGADTDEPEGARYIQLSETLVNQMVEALK